METLARSANRGSVSTGYDIDNSLKFEPDNGEYLSRGASSSGTNRKTFTVSYWTKRTEMSAPIHTYTGSHPYQVVWLGGVNGEATRMGWWGTTPTDAFWVDIGGGSGNGTTQFRSYTSSVFRDTSAWYHVVMACDTTQATAADRLKVWINGVEQTNWQQQQLPTQDFQCAVEAGIEMNWGGYTNVQPMAGYLAECHYLDGVTATATDFGEYDSDSGIWKPKAYSGSYGTNGCYLDFSDSSSLGADSSGNGNNFTLANITSADQATDTPTNSFTTFNDKYHYQNTQVYAEAVVNNGGTTWETTRASWWRTGYSNNGVSNGKWYAEFSANTTTFMVGVGSIDRIDGAVDNGPNTHLGATNTGAIGFYLANGRLFENGSLTIGWGGTANANDIIGIALDMDNGKVYFAINNTWQNSANPAAGTGGISLTYPDDAYYMGVSFFGVNECKGNWGGYTEISIASGNADADGYGNFEYAPPTGYYAWCTKNLAEYG